MIQDIKALIDGLEIDEFGAVSAVVNYLNQEDSVSGRKVNMEELNDAIKERAEREVENADEQI